MNKLLTLLSNLTRRLGSQTTLRKRAVNRYHARLQGRDKALREVTAAENAADRHRARAHQAKALHEDRKAAREEARAQHKDDLATTLKGKASREDARALVHKARIRRYTQRIHGLEVRLDKVREELAKLGPVVHLQEQKVTGGTPRERWIKFNLTEVECCANGRRRNAYSQAGKPDIWHPFGPGPASDRRDDCSSDTTACALGTGLPDPNGLNYSGQGFTGTLRGNHNGWKTVSLEHMMKVGWGYVVYGSGSGHHVERYCPSESDPMRTVGHGSPPVDFGTVHLFGPGEVETYHIWDPS